MPCLIKKASRCAADHTSRTTMFFIILSSTFYKIQRSYEKIMCICYFIGSLVKIVLYLHFLDINDKDFDKLKRNMNDGTIVFLTSCLSFLSDTRSFHFLNKEFILFFQL